MALFNINYLKKTIWPLDETLTSITTPDQSGPESNEGMTLHSPTLQNWSFAMGCSLVSHPSTGNTVNVF